MEKSKAGRPIQLGSVNKELFSPGASKTARLKESWQVFASNLVKTELLKQDKGYRELAVQLGSLGLRISAEVLNRRVNRGDLSAGIFLMCMTALGVTRLEFQGPLDAETSTKRIRPSRKKVRP